MSSASLPTAIQEHLVRLAAGERSPAWLCANDAGEVTDVGGATGCYGLEDLAIGASVEASVDVLCGLIPVRGDDVCLPFVEVAPNVWAELRAFRRESGHWVVFLTPEVAVDELRASRQTAHDAALRLREVETRVCSCRVLEELVKARGAIVFELADDGSSPRVGDVPAWAAPLIDADDGADELAVLAARFPVLESFLVTGSSCSKASASFCSTSSNTRVRARPRFTARRSATKRVSRSRTTGVGSNRRRSAAAADSACSTSESVSRRWVVDWRSHRCRARERARA